MFPKYDREELYQKIWERPLIKVAEEYGVSAVALGKACRKLSVPMPGRGHWARLAHGLKGTPKPPLKQLDKVPIIYRSRRSEQRVAMVSDPEFDAIDQLLASGALNPQPPSSQSSPHILIRRTASRLRRRSRKDEKGILLPSEPGGLDVRVTHATLHRSLGAMASILFVLESQGVKVETSEHGAFACVNGQQVAFGIEEAVRSVVTQKSRIPHPTSRWDYDRTVTYEPTGALALVIHADSWPPLGVRKRWGDGKNQRFESLISEFVAGLMRTSVALRRQAEERRKRDEEMRQREQARAKLREEIDAEQEKLEQLNQWMDNWDKAERLRRFIAVYSDKTSKWAEDRQSHYKQWIEWANEQADRLDPFISAKPASVLDRELES